jgi:hypothetical protein
MFGLITGPTSKGLCAKFRLIGHSFQPNIGGRGALAIQTEAFNHARRNV